MGKASTLLFEEKNSKLKESITELGIKSNEEILLLAEKTEVDVIATSLDLASKAAYQREITKSIREIDVLEKRTKGFEVYKGDSILSICLEYGLVLVRFSNCKRYLPDDVLLKINKIIKEEGSDFSDLETFGYLLVPKHYCDGKYGKYEATKFVVFYKFRDSGRGKMKDTFFAKLASSNTDFSLIDKVNRLSIDYTEDGSAAVFIGAMLLMVTMSLITCLSPFKIAYIVPMMTMFVCIMARLEFSKAWLIKKMKNV